VKYTYLIINVLTIIFPVILSFDKRVAFAKSWKFIWPGMAITGLLFLFWDVLFTIHGVWSFNDKYIIGIRFYGLPLEEILFFLTVPFSCIFIYACLNYYIKWQPGNIVTRMVSNLLIGLSIALLALNYTRLYTAVTFGLLAVLLVLLMYYFKVKWLNRFYMAFIVSLIPFYIVNGILTAWPIVLYNDAQNMGIRAGTIPFEDHFYSMALLLMNIGFFEYFKNGKKLAV
jgi:lycopene cyclase domain-containing protein